MIYGWAVFGICNFVLSLTIIIISFLERKKLVNMLMSRDYTEYASFELENKILKGKKEPDNDTIPL